jgi:hypothetical protein
MSPPIVFEQGQSVAACVGTHFFVLSSVHKQGSVLGQVLSAVHVFGICNYLKECLLRDTN